MRVDQAPNSVVVDDSIATAGRLDEAQLLAFGLVGTAGQGRRVHQVQDAVFFRQPVKTVEDSGLPLLITFFRPVQLLALSGFQELPQEAKVDGITGIEVSRQTLPVTMVLAEGHLLLNAPLLLQAGAGELFLDAGFQCLFVGLHIAKSGEFNCRN